MFKLYEDFHSTNAVEQVICEDIRLKGVSHGWNGDIDTFIIIKDKLAKQNVCYGYLGTWKLNNKTKQ